MGRKAKKSGSGAGTLVVAIVMAIIFAPKGGWTVFLVFVLGCVLVAIFGKKKEQGPATTTNYPTSAAPHGPSSSSSMPPTNIGRRAQSDDEFLTVTLSADSPSSSYRIARPALETTAGVRWVGPGEKVEISGVAITGGMFYLGVPKRVEATSLDACVLNPKANVAKTASDLSAGSEDYWLSYQSFSAEQRGAYLQWLASDRSDTRLHRSFAFFYFYGLERRVLFDGIQGKVQKAELETIASELKRLKSVYSNVLRTVHIDGLLEFIFVHLTHPQRQYDQLPGTISSAFEVPLSIRVAFGQAAVDKKPVPSDWALAWALGDGGVYKRTPVTRCEDEFRQLFRRKYREQFRDGMKLTANKTKLKVSAQTAFPALQGIEYPDYITSLPDIAAVTGPRNKLQQLVNECSDSLDAYSRFLGRNPDAKGSLESALTLPVELWPESARLELESLASTVVVGTVVMTFGSLLEKFKASGSITRDKLTALARVLGEAGVAIEPDARISGRTPKSAEYVGLYATPPNTSTNFVDDSYLTFALMVDMAASIAMADGNASEQEVALIHRQIESWPQLTPRQQDRLKARAAVQIAQPPTPMNLKKRLEPLSAEAKVSVATLLVQTANADGFVSPAEVKMLEKLYQMLGLDPQRLYGDLHGNTVVGSSSALRPSTGPEKAPSGSAQPAFTLDTARIEALQKETAEVSALLADVFAGEVPVAEPVQETVEPQTGSASLLGLDAAHSTFLRLLLSRSSWTRSELSDAASDLELMLDGAIEQVNEASLDHWDEPLTDGDDPVEINQEFAQRLAS
ncbi:MULTISPECIES: TerB N-terminal domain-containing protein [unclassified Paraburkholderia]|uniref:tellurite resistance TerB family protein n=1 Tax=unclassified Paraburkholderia TaxID=2615204 RepID=UPI00179C1F6C|nr:MULTISPECIES: TerB N-terminal domain-containing protein [unclassified Paraburkholderia]MBB5441584.1 tellurite resistance protein [Paraburkholderia sp. WSM4177]MBB5481979.1 tellurite resistance protein [Paraburkholderia sp. WSM4180]